MLKKLLYGFIFLVSMTGYSQYFSEFEVGPMLNYQHTSLYVDNSVFGEEEGSSNSGFESNYAVGVYGIYYWKPSIGIGAELYYDKTSSDLLGNENHYNSLTFMPYLNYDPFRQVRNLYFGGGVGLSFIQESPEYGSTVKEEDVRVITIPVKLSASYRVRNQFTFEVGANIELMEVVENTVRRNAVYFGVKIPVNRVFGQYR